MHSLDNAIKVLLVESQQQDAEFLKHILSSENHPPFQLEHIERLSLIPGKLCRGGFDIVLLSLSVLEGGEHGSESFSSVYSRVGAIPIVVLSGVDDEKAALDAVECGAQDYLVKNEINGKILSKVIRHAIARKKVEESLNRSEEYLQTLTTGAPVIIFATDKNGIFTLSEGKGLHALGLKAGEVVGKSIFDVYEDSPKILADIRRALAGEIFTDAIEVRGVYFETWYSPIYGQEGEVSGVIGVATDITDRKHLEMERQKLSLAIEQSPTMFVITDTEGRIEYVNKKFTEITGYTLEDVKGETPRILKSGETSTEIYKQLWDTIKSGKEWRGEFHNKKKNGDLYWEMNSISSVKDEQGKITHFLAVKEDVTKRKWAEETIVHLAYHDTLTDLPNRFLMQDRLNQALSQARRRKKLVGLMLLGIDRFKGVNEMAGHSVGDQVLQAVAKRLSGCVREVDTVARLSGDEFMVLLPEMNSVEEAAKIAQQILDVIKPSFNYNSHELNLTCSIGVSVYPHDGEDAESLLKDAETALGRAKQQGRNNYQLYTPTMHVETFGRMVLENSMRKALSREEFLIHYQPVVDLRTKRMIGMEALLRWQHPDIGLVSPVEFIPIAEENGLIVPIGEWVLRTACTQCKAWQRAGLPPLRIAVNLSARQFQHANLLEMVEWVLKDVDLEPQYLEFEITESIAMENVDFTLTILKRLKEMGVGISIDDFGTGYSSLNYLKQFPIDILKIDRSFIRELTVDANSQAIVSAVIVLAHSLNLKVTAEGVETPEQLEFLKRQKCDNMQGYFFSKPVPTEQFEALVMQNKRL